MINLSKQFSSRGFVILGFPCNQFLWQEPRGPEAIQAFAQSKGFEPPHMLLMEKVNVTDGVTGSAHPLFNFLLAETGSKISWNFGTYFLVSKTGKVSDHRNVEPQRLASSISTLLDPE